MFARVGEFSMQVALDHPAPFMCAYAEHAENTFPNRISMRHTYELATYLNTYTIIVGKLSPQARTPIVLEFGDRRVV